METQEREKPLAQSPLIATVGEWELLDVPPIIKHSLKSQEQLTTDGEDKTPLKKVRCIYIYR